MLPRCSSCHTWSHGWSQNCRSSSHSCTGPNALTLSVLRSYLWHHCSSQVPDPVLRARLVKLLHQVMDLEGGAGRGGNAAGRWGLVDVASTTPVPPASPSQSTPSSSSFSSAPDSRVSVGNGLNGGGVNGGAAGRALCAAGVGGGDGMVGCSPQVSCATPIASWTNGSDCLMDNQGGAGCPMTASPRQLLQQCHQAEGAGMQGHCAAGYAQPQPPNVPPAADVPAAHATPQSDWEYSGRITSGCAAPLPGHLSSRSTSVEGCGCLQAGAQGVWLTSGVTDMQPTTAGPFAADQAEPVRHSCGPPSAAAAGELCASGGPAASRADGSTVVGGGARGVLPSACGVPPVLVQGLGRGLGLAAAARPTIPQASAASSCSTSTLGTAPARRGSSISSRGGSSGGSSSSSGLHVRASGGGGAAVAALDLPMCQPPAHARMPPHEAALVTTSTAATLLSLFFTVSHMLASLHL